MITTPEIICDLFSFLDKDQIERIQLVNQFWNNVIIRHKNILPLRLFAHLEFNPNLIYLYATEDSDTINFDETNLRKGKRNVTSRSSRYSQLTVDEVLTNLNDVVFNGIYILNYHAEVLWDDLLNMIKLVTTKIGSRLRGRFGFTDTEGFNSKRFEFFDNYIIVDQLCISNNTGCGDLYIREVCANPEIVQLPSTPKEIRLMSLYFDEEDEVLHFTCNGKLNGANRLTIGFETSDDKYGNFIRQWFELYRTHQNPITLVGKFQHVFKGAYVWRVFDDVKTFLNNTQLRVKYSLETKESGNPYLHCIDEFRHPSLRFTQYVNRRCVLHKTDSYALVIEMAYETVANMSSINASDLDQPPCDTMETISFCVKSL